MLTRWSDFDTTFTIMDELRRRMDRLFDEADESTPGRPWTGRVLPTDFAGRAWPHLHLFDDGSNLLVEAEVPGVVEKDIDITINQDVLTLKGVRKSDAPEGYSVHRQERVAARFDRSFTLPCKVDAEKTSASLKNGVLTITLAKAPEAQPKKITVRAQ